MAKQYVKIYYDWTQKTATLSPAEKGRLVDAMVEYAKCGEIPTLSGGERYLFPVFQVQIDRDTESYQSKVNNGQKGGLANRSELKRNEAKLSETKQEKEKEKEKEINKERIKKESADALPDSFSPKMKEAVERWLRYKSERREAYKPSGRQALISQIENRLKTWSEEDVIALIEECMANGWRGIIWDRLDRKPQKQQTTYDLDEFEQLMKSYVPR